MLAHLIDALDRKHAFFVRADDGLAALQLARYLAWMTSEPLVRDVLAELDGEAADVHAWEEAESQIVDELLSIRTELVARAPDQDDSSEPEPPAHTIDSYRWYATLASFDKLAARWQSERNESPYQRIDHHTVKDLVIVLGRKFAYVRCGEDPESPYRHPRAGVERSDFDDLFARFVSVAEQQDSVHRRLINDRRIHAGAALNRLRWLVAQLDDRGPTELVDADDRYRELRAATADDERDRRRQHIDEARGDEAILYEEVRHRLGTQRSHLRIVERFRVRCQWHDRDRLRVLAERSPSHAEDLLAGEFARYLFDNGLSPVTRPLVGGLEPDLFEPAAQPVLYVEAKQYDGSAREYLVRGVRQVWDTMDRLRGSVYHTDEAFLVIFRRGGPVCTCFRTTL
jgi:hypothetical protein